MRWGFVLLAVLALGLLAGCGGGEVQGKAGVVPPDELRLSYFRWKAGTVSGSGGQEEEFSELFVKLAVPQSAPVLANMTLAVPELSRSLRLQGPAAIAPEDGISADTVPQLVYWGTGDAVPAGQPQVVQPGDWLPGYTRPEGLYFYTGHLDLDAPIALITTPSLTADGDYARQWSLPAGEMLAIPRVSFPLAPVLNTARPARIAWAAVPGAAGYFVTVKGDVRDENDVIQHRVVWTSAHRPLLFEALYDPTPDLLPAETREIIIPARIFTKCEAVQVSVFAQTAPALDDSATPSFKRVNAALGIYVFATFQMP